MSLENVRYDAFISYRHCELDSFISENLHKKLENYKLPASVIKKLDPNKTKIERVFRDEAELPLSSNLSDPISEALDNSEFLIVICTPRLPESQWCKKEIEAFVKTHDREHVLLVLAEGEPEQSFPDILMHEDITAKDENGNDVTVTVAREPLAADCRGTDNRQRLKSLDNVVLKLCAAIFGLNYDDLKQRHRERMIRRRLIAMSVALAIVTIFAVTCLSFMLKINKQNKVISDKYAGAMASVSEDLLSQGLRSDAVYAARSVLPDNAEKGFNADAYNSLVKGLAPYEIENCYFPSGCFNVPQDTAFFSVSDDKSYALVRGDDSFHVMDIRENTEICSTDSGCSDQAVFCGDDVVYTDCDMRVIYLEPDTGKETVLCDEGYELYAVPNGGPVLVFAPEWIRAFNGKDEAFVIDLTETDDLFNAIDDPDYTVDDVFFTKDGRFAAFALAGIDSAWYAVVDIGSGKLTECIRDDVPNFMAVGYYDDILYVCTSVTDPYGDMNETSTIYAVDTHSGEEVSADVAGVGFYEMLIDDNGILLISDTLAYVLDHDLSTRSAITGYMNEACAFTSNEGYVLIDSLGQLKCEDVYSDIGKSYRLYGHNGDARISSAVYKEDDIYIRYTDNNRVVIYSPLGLQYEGFEEISDARDFNGYTDEEVDTSALQGIDEMSIFNAAVSDDGRFIAVNTNDGALHIYDADSGRRIKELYDTDTVLFHRSFPYLKQAGVYVIENRIFNESFDMISVLPDGEITAIGNDEKSIVIRSGYSLNTFYRINILTYDEMINKADDVLSGHIPDRDICEKYNIGG